MDVNQLIKLVEAGYTKAEIEAMSTSNAQEQTEQTEQETQTTGTEAQEETTKTPTVEEAYSNMFNALNKQVEEFSKKLEGLNVKMAEQPNKQERTIEDMIASIVTPKGEPLK